MGTEYDLLAVGAINRDYVLRSEPTSRVIGDQERLLPRQQAILRLKDTAAATRLKEPGGSAFNTARSVCALHAKLRVGFIGCVGLADQGDRFLRAIKRSGMSLDLVKRAPGERSGVCFASINRETGHRDLLTSPFANERMSDWLREIWRKRADELARARALHVTSLFDDRRRGKNASSAALADFVDAVRKRNPGMLISFDPGSYWIEHHRRIVKRILRQADVLFVNGAEMAALVDRENEELSTEMAEQILGRGTRTSAIVVLKGADQVCCFHRVKGAVKTRTYQANRLPKSGRRNPVGTGDALAAGFLAAQLLRLDLDRSVAMGQELARIKLLSSETSEAEQRFSTAMVRVESDLEIPHTRRWDAKLQHLTRRFHLYACRLAEPPAHARATRRKGPALQITNEYAVHYLLYILLRGEWDAVEPEIQMPGALGKSGRCDLGIKPLKTLVECKFVRKASQLRSVTEWIDSVGPRYSPHPNYDKLFLFIYDPTGAIPINAYRHCEGERAGFDDVRIGIAGPHDKRE